MKNTKYYVKIYKKQPIVALLQWKMYSRNHMNYCRITNVTNKYLN